MFLKLQCRLYKICMKQTPPGPTLKDSPNSPTRTVLKKLYLRTEGA